MGPRAGEGVERQWQSTSLRAVEGEQAGLIFCATHDLFSIHVRTQGISLTTSLIVLKSATGSAKADASKSPIFFENMKCLLWETLKCSTRSCEPSFQTFTKMGTCTPTTAHRAISETPYNQRISETPVTISETPDTNLRNSRYDAPVSPPRACGAARSSGPSWTLSLADKFEQT